MATGLATEARTRARRPGGAVAALVAQAAAGDERAWEQLVEEFAGLVWATARAHHLGAADAADVVQTTWMRLVEHLDRLQEPAKVGAWLAVTARRECLRVLRGRARTRPMGDELPERVDDGPGVSEAVIARERDAALWAAVGRLGERDRALLRLLMADPAPRYEEIGAALGMPIGSIGPTRARCLERLRREAARLGVTRSDLEA
jgi:RNA polymerase sigma factor (sigma-70 family)